MKRLPKWRVLAGALIVYGLSYFALRAVGFLDIAAGYSGSGEFVYLGDSLYVETESDSLYVITSYAYFPLGYAEALVRGHSWRTENLSHRPDYPADESPPYAKEIVELPFYFGGYNIDGHTVGTAGEPGPFYLLSKKVYAAGDGEVFERMLTNECPAVRAMGIVCLIRGGERNRDRILSLRDDQAGVIVRSFGCVGSEMSIGEFASAMITNDWLRSCYIDEDGS